MTSPRPGSMIQSTNLQSLMDLEAIVADLDTASTALNSVRHRGMATLPASQRGELHLMRSQITGLEIAYKNEIARLRIGIERGDLHPNDQYLIP